MIYEEWYAFIVRHLPGTAGAALELGSGGGFLGTKVPDIITSDCTYLPWINLVTSGSTLPFKNKTLRGLVCIDVLHHLSDPCRLFAEAERCLRPGGTILLIEPWVTAWSSLIYASFHHEPFDPKTLEWETPVSGPLAGANIALPWIMFERDRIKFEGRFPFLKIDFINLSMPFRYLLSGGIGHLLSAPAMTFTLWKKIEGILSPFNKHLAMFAYCKISKKQ